MSKSKKLLKDRLPKKPSALIRLAVQDVKRARKAGYEINMGSWHAPEKAWDEQYQKEIDADRARRGGDKHCQVCFAGSVLACRTGIQPDEYSPMDTSNSPYRMDKSLRGKLAALNNFREGEIQMGLRDMGLKRPPLMVESIGVPEYDDDHPKPFFKAMEMIAAGLQKVGL